MPQQLSAVGVPEAARIGELVDLADVARVLAEGDGRDLPGMGELGAAAGAGRRGPARGAAPYGSALTYTAAENPTHPVEAVHRHQAAPLGENRLAGEALDPRIEGGSGRSR